MCRSSQDTVLVITKTRLHASLSSTLIQDSVKWKVRLTPLFQVSWIFDLFKVFFFFEALNQIRNRLFNGTLCLQKISTHCSVNASTYLDQTLGVCRNPVNHKNVHGLAEFWTRDIANPITLSRLSHELIASKVHTCSLQIKCKYSTCMDQYIAHMTPKQMWTLKFLVLDITITAAFTDEWSFFTGRLKGRRQICMQNYTKLQQRWHKSACPNINEQEKFLSSSPKIHHTRCFGSLYRRVITTI